MSVSNTISLTDAMEDVTSTTSHYYFTRKNFFRKMAIKLKIAKRKKEVYSEKERNILTIVRKLCANKFTKIEQNNLGYILYNEEDLEHIIDCIITSKYVIVTNCVYTSEKEYSDTFIKKLNKLCENRVTLNCNIRMEKMLARENNMLVNIKSNI